MQNNYSSNNENVLQKTSKKTWEKKKHGQKQGVLFSEDTNAQKCFVLRRLLAQKWTASCFMQRVETMRFLQCVVPATCFVIL
jgi:hypothetical protein